MWLLLVYHYLNLTSVSLAVPASPLAVRPLLCLLWREWYHLLYIDLPQPNRGLLSPIWSWKEPLYTAMAWETSLLYREGIFIFLFYLIYFYQTYILCINITCFTLQLYTGWDTSNSEPSVWGDQQQQQSCNKIHPVQSGTDVCVVGSGWSEDEAKQQEDNVDSDEGIVYVSSVTHLVPQDFQENEENFIIHYS